MAMEMGKPVNIELAAASGNRKEQRGVAKPGPDRYNMFWPGAMASRTGRQAPHALTRLLEDC